MRRANRRNIRVIIGGSLLISATLVQALDGLAPVMVGDGGFVMPLVSAAMFVPGLYLLIASLFDD